MYYVNISYITLGCDTMHDNIGEQAVVGFRVE